jgi:selenide, water dikinase
MESIRLTQYSHGAGCGCKISPKNLEIILQANKEKLIDPNLLVGFDTKDDAAVYAINDTQAVISTTDFFMPIVDDAYDFGRIAATNAISDIYAMGGKPTMAIAILGWPVNKLPLELAGQVVAGGRSVCTLAGIPLAGGHSIDSPEPIFGLAVTGLIDRDKIKRNDTARAGDILFLTKQLGVGIYSTAQKKGFLSIEDKKVMIENMCTLNKIGALLAQIEGVHAMTDVTGFGLAGHLIEMAEGSGVSAELDYAALPLLPNVQQYIDLGAIPGGTNRNWDSYGHKMKIHDETQKIILADPQTSGGLLIAIDQSAQNSIEEILKSNGISINKIGSMVSRTDYYINIINNN